MIEIINTYFIKGVAMQKMRVFIAALIVTLFGLNAANKPNAAKLAQMQKESQKRINDFGALLKELFSMDFAAFKKRVPSVSEQRQGLLLLSMATPKALRKSEFGDVKDEREKVLFLASKMKDKSGGGGVLYWAYNNNDKDAIQKLKKMGYLSSQALAVAIALKDERIMNSLLKEGVEVTSDSIRALIASPKFSEDEKSKKLLKKLLPKVKNLNQLDKSGWNLLDYAANAEAAQILLDAGVRFRKNADALASHVVTVGMFQEIAKRNQSRLTKSQSESLKNDIKGKAELIEFYIKQGADPLERGKQGKSAMDIAKKEGLDEVIAIFQKKKK
ncbi:hypothetical protein ACFLXW_00315 [Candidatus Dependentiae bacterium]